MPPRSWFTELNQLPLALQMGNFHCELLSWGFFEPRWWRNYLHKHSHFEICYAFQGQGIFRIAEKDYTVRQGDVFVARPGNVHEIIASTADPLGIYFWSYTLIPVRDHKRKSQVEVDELEIDSILHAFQTSTCYVSNRVPAMEATLELLTEEIVKHQPGYRQIIEGLVTKLILDTARATIDPSIIQSAQEPAKMQSARTPEEAIVQIIVRYLRDNYAHPITIRDLAAQVHLSERHTSRLFHKVMGTSIIDYLTTVRLEVAAQRLIDHNTPIKEIAQECGYPDVRYFSTLFRLHNSMTPGAFRKKGGTLFIEHSD